MARYIKRDCSRTSRVLTFRTIHVLTLALFLLLLTPFRVSADGFIPTDGGLVVDLKKGDQVLISVMVDHDNNPATPDREYFVGNYTRYTGDDYFTYAGGYFLKLFKQEGETKPAETIIWTVDTALTRLQGGNNYSLGGISYTLWNDGKTLMTKNTYQFFGDLVDKRSDAKCTDAVFVIPTARSTVTSFDPNRTLSATQTDRTERTDQDPQGRFNGRTGTGFLGMTYREVYWLVIPRFNIPIAYTNGALVTFNTTSGEKDWSSPSGVGKVASGRAAYSFADTKHNGTPRTVFRLYILNDPIVTCPDSYFFAYDEQNFVGYRKGPTTKAPIYSWTDSTTQKKIYTMDRLFRMNKVGDTDYYQTELMKVPVPDSAYYYVGVNDDYRAAASGQTLNEAGSHSQFTKIRQLPMEKLAGKYAPAGACGRMVADATSSVDNINVKFKPAGYFLKISTGTNVQMRPNADSTIWTCEEMWHITDQYAALQIKATLFSGASYSSSDPGVDVAGWSRMVTGTSVPLADGSGYVTGGMDGWARIHVDNTDENGHMEFIMANPAYHIHYDNNDFPGDTIPNQHPASDESTVTVENARIMGNFTFTHWNTAPDGSGASYLPGQTFTFTEPGEVILYAQGTYNGTYNVALSFIHPSNGKRYFLTHPGSSAPRYSRARHFDDWTNVWQGMNDATNTDPLYLNSFELRHPIDEIKAKQDPSMPDLEAGEFVLDPRHYTMKGAVDSLTFYEYFAPPKDEFLGLYYTSPNTIIANDTWAGLFKSTSTATTIGWPDFRQPFISSTKLYSTRYVEEEDPDEHPDSLTLKVRSNNSEGTYVKYQSASDQFDGVVSAGDATEFQISAISVADEHYVVLPDTTDTWRDEIVFDYNSGVHKHELVKSKLIGKQLLACMFVDGDTTYFHPNRNKIYTTANELRLSSDFRLTETFTFIRDTRVTSVDDDDRPAMEETSDDFSRDVVGGHESPMNVTYKGSYIDIVDTLRIRLTQDPLSKIKNYYGRWKKGYVGAADSLLHINGTTRYRDVLVRTKTYHYGAARSYLVLTPEENSYTFNPLANNSQTINFTLTKMNYLSILDVDGNIVSEEFYSSEDVTSKLALIPSACTFSSGGGIFNIDEALSHHITISTIELNKSENQYDTLTISTTVTVEGVAYPVTARVPLMQTSLEGDELIWSVMDGKQRYYIMAGTNGLIFRKYKENNSILYKENSSTPLEKGSADAENNDAKYITPWHFRYNPENANQLSLKTEYGVNRYLKMLGDVTGSKAAIHENDSSFFTYHYVHVYTNDNANEEEQVKLQYGADKWLQFTQTDGSGQELKLVENENDASVFSWSYLLQEYSLLNNGTYPSCDSVTFGYNTNMSVSIQTRYQAYKEYSMLVGNKVVYLCRKSQTRIDSLTAANRPWLTSYNITRIPDARDFDGSPDPVSGLSNTLNTSNLNTTVSTSSATTSPTNVTIGGKYVNIVDTLHVTVSLQSGAPAYRFKDKWSSFKSVKDAELKIPLIRKTFHVEAYDTVACLEVNEEFDHTFPNTVTTPVSYTFNLATVQRTGYHVLDVQNIVYDERDATETDISAGMDLNNKNLAAVQLTDAFGQTPDWCRLKAKDAKTITVECTKSGIRSPRTAYLRIVYIVTVNGQPRYVNYRLSVSQPSLYEYANNQHLVHSSGASGDPLDAKGMQQVHENKRILYYYPDQNVELPVRENHFFGWWRWFREGEGEIGDSDIPEEVWRQKPINSGFSSKGELYDYPFRIIGDSVWVDSTRHELGKKLVTMGRYSVFHYKSSQYNDVRNNPPVGKAMVAPPITTYGEAVKPTVTYAVDISNYYDKLPMSVSASQKNQVDTARLDTMRAIPEPTLSIREVFELHPWTEMADRLENYKSTRTADDAGEYELANEDYMENHIVMAPLNNQLLLSTEQRYNRQNVTDAGHSESLLGYYMRDDNWATAGWDAARKDSMIWCAGWDAQCQWYEYSHKTKKYTPCTYKITTGDDFLIVPKKENIPSGQDFDTIYYCLRARSWATTGTPGTTEKSDSGAYMFNICRYMIIYHDPSLYGPKLENDGKAIITNDEIEQRYEVLERLNFDYNKPGTDDYTVYPHPLPWADASYGYTYPETPDLPHNRLHTQSDLPNFGEYGLVNRIHYTDYWYDMEQHGGAKNGYMIYCDGMSSSGQVAALSLSTHLCSGQKMFFSCYVGNPSSQKDQRNLSKPNFIFEVQGSEDGENWEDITSYMTGDIDTSSLWYQIYFPINFISAKEYDHFRVRIYNMASSWNGNDFVIDDMCIFATKPPLIAYQAHTACKEKDDEETPTNVILRVDYQGITGEGYNNKEVYYTVKCVNKEGVTSFVNMLDGYLDPDPHPGSDPTKPDTLCGRLFIPSLTYDPSEHTDSIYVNMDDLLEAFEKSNFTTKEGYIYESLEGITRPVKYAIHHAILNPADTFTVHMSAEYKELLSSICGMTSYLKVSNQMVLELNGEEVSDMEQGGLCANATYNIGLRVKGSLYLDGVAPVDLNGTCVNDWLLYGDTAKDSSLARYGYYYSDIVKVVKDILRCEPPGTTNTNQFAPNLAAVSRNEMQRIMENQSVELSSDKHPYDILADLVNKGFLKLYQPNITATVYAGDSVQYVIFPIIGTGSDALHAANVEVCPLPILIKLKPDPASAKSPLIVGGLNRPASEMNQPIVVLASYVNANHEITIKVDSIMPLVGIRSVELLSTDDPDYIEGTHSLAYRPDLDYPAEDYYTKGSDIILYPASSNNYYMQQGYTYTYGIVMQTILGQDTLDGGCQVGTVPFSVSIVPNYLRWDPQNESSPQWNNPANWVGITEDNQFSRSNARFAPLPTTSVIIPELTDGAPYPVLTDPADPGFTDSVKQAGFEYNVCKDIRFMPGAAMGNQQLLTYDKAIVDMTLPHGKWALRSSPVNGMISGDVFMAENDLLGISNPWEVGEFDAAGRSSTTGNASFWLSVYSRETNRVGNGDQVADTARVAVADWSKVTNALTLPLPSGQGWAVYARTATEKDAQVRLPKNDDVYYYYYKNGDKVLDKYEHHLRDLRDKVAGTSTTGKLAYYPTKSSSESYTITNDTASTGARIETTSFIFGNPTMGYIDIWGFIADNGLVEEFRYIGSDGNWKEPVTKGTAATTTDTISTIERYLPPMQAIEVHVASKVSTKTFELNTNRVVTDHHQVVPSASPAPKRATASIKKGIMTITATNPVSPRCVSRLLLGQGYNKEIIKGEDAMLTTVNIDNYSNTSYPATPFNIYAVEDGQGLSVNLLDTITYVPLSFYMSDLPFEPITYLWFTGVNKIGGRLFLYDALTDTERPIMDGICLAIETPEISHQRRYYIRREGPVPTVPDDPIDPISTDIENVTNSTPLEAYKIIHNGHVYIIRNGHVYTMFGQKVR